MGSYRKNMAAAVRWAIVAMIVVALFWLIWNTIAGSVPTVRTIYIGILNWEEFYLGTFSLPLPYNRWWDVPFAFIIILTYWPLAYGFEKLTPHLGVKAGKKPGPPSEDLKVGSALGLVCGLILGALFSPILGLATMLAVALLLYVLIGWGEGWGSISLQMLGLWLGASLAFGLVVGLGIGWIIGLSVIASVFFIATIVANLTIGFKGFVPSLRGSLPGVRGWLAAEDIE